LDATCRKQSTIKKPVSVSGFGFWSGLDVTIEFRPADENTGIRFVRTDLPGQPQILAIIQNRVTGPRRTTLVQNGCAVEMVEHVMAALAGLEIDNCEIHVTRAEMPGMDGSSQPFVTALFDAGRTRQSAFKPTFRVLHKTRVEHGDAWIEATPVNGNETILSYQLTYENSPAIGSQTFTTSLTRSSFIEKVASARTFLLASEAEQLKEQGLGGRVTYSDVLVFDDSGPVNNRLRFPNECARHKMLDMIGDFALSGKHLIGSFTASRSGHLLNSKMIFALIQQIVTSHPNRQSA
jgi:UDP-3-O-acyl N-acetylglucosamine deacetylase